MARKSWFDPQSQSPLIEQHARQLSSYVETIADGKVEAAEVERQEARLVALMKALEPKLDDALHAQVTELLCEVTAYDLMQALHLMQQARPRALAWNP